MLFLVSWVISIFLKSIGTILAIFLIREIYCLIHYFYYRKQGMRGYYFPILGFNFLMIKRKDRKGQFDLMVEFIQKMHKENVDAVVCNSNKIAKNLVVLLDSDLVKEYYAKELEYTKKRQLINNVNFGFFWDHGNIAMEKRKAFGEFFKISNLNAMTPLLLKIVEGHFEDLINKHWVKEKRDKNQPIRIDLKIELAKIFDKSVSQILFGEEAISEVNGIPLPTLMSTYINTSVTDVLSPANLLTFDLLGNLGLTKGTIEGKKMYKELKKAAMDIYKRRLQEGGKEGVNMMDLMVAHNSNPENVPWTEEEIVGNFILFQFAGVDTSKETTNTFVHYIAGKHKLQEEILKVLNDSIFKKKKEEIDFDVFDSSPEFNNYINEILRKFPPFYFTNTRTVMKPMKIGKYDILPGTALFVLGGTHHFVEKYHKDYEVFNKERFSEENRKKMNKMAFLPFSTGQRRCIGQYLGELMLKLMVSSILKFFIIDRVEGYDPDKISTLTYCYQDCWVNLRPREK